MQNDIIRNNMELREFDMAEETQAYQTLLEGHRNNPDDELIYQDMLKAKAQMEVAWLQQCMK